MLPGRAPDPRQRAQAMDACCRHDLGSHHPGRARRARGHDRPQCPELSRAGLAVAASPARRAHGGVRIGSVVEVLGGAIGRSCCYCRSPASPSATCCCAGTWGPRSHSAEPRRPNPDDARVDLTLTMDREKNPHPSAVRFLNHLPRTQQTRSQPGHDLMRVCEGSRLVSDRPRQRQPCPDPGPR
jgi:hypothetical protein